MSELKLLTALLVDRDAAKQFIAQRTAFLLELGFEDAPQMGLVVANLIADQNGFRYRPEGLVKCSLCGDIWHTNARVGEGEVCTECGDTFMIHTEDIATQEEYENQIEGGK